MPRALLILLAACGHPTAPAACDAMCVEAEALYGGCLEAWGLDWSAVGHRDGAEFRDSCATWSWEMAILERDAVRRGRIEGPGALEETCASRAAIFGADEATCADYTGLDWSLPPWEAP